MFTLALQLWESEMGRNFGWFVEYEGAVIGELDNPQVSEMFWVSYAARPLGPQYANDFSNEDLWVGCKFRFRNRVMNEYVDTAACSGRPIFDDGRVYMRGLYLLPASWIESCVITLRSWIPINKKPPLTQELPRPSSQR
jgi:hypothetical protein